MGLFDGLLKKKTCAFCGGEIGLLGNRKLEDGDMCKNCAAKLSPWFDERRHSTVEQIGKQLEYREQNRAAVANFNTTRSIGNNSVVYLDEPKKKFMITSKTNLAEANPDVVDASAIKDVRIDIKEMKHELHTQDKDGKSVSYNPPRYDYSYDFFVDVDVNHPYFDNMRAKVNGSSVWIRYKDIEARRIAGIAPTMAGGAFTPGGQVAGAGIAGAVLNGLAGAAGMNLNAADTYSPEYQEMLFTAQDIKDSLMMLRAAALGTEYTAPAQTAAGTAAAGTAGIGTAGAAGVTNMPPGPAAGAQIKYLAFDSDNPPEGCSKGFGYTLNPPIENMPMVIAHTKGNFAYMVIDARKYALFESNLPKTVYMALTEAFMNGVPGVDPQTLPQHEIELFAILKQTIAYHNLVDSGIEPMGVKIESVSVQSLNQVLSDAMAQAQQTMQAQGGTQAAPQVTKPLSPDAWQCPHCMTSNLGKFCSNCGAPKPGV